MMAYSAHLEVITSADAKQRRAKIRGALHVNVAVGGFENGNVTGRG